MLGKTQRTKKHLKAKSAALLPQNVTLRIRSASYHQCRSAVLSRCHVISSWLSGGYWSAEAVVDFERQVLQMVLRHTSSHLPWVGWAELVHNSWKVGSFFLRER